jgi:hypothetical protein
MGAVSCSCSRESYEDAKASAADSYAIYSRKATEKYELAKIYTNQKTKEAKIKYAP